MMVKQFVVALVTAFALAGAAHAAEAINFEGPRVKVETSMGDFVIMLHVRQAPKTVANFLIYVREGHYDNKVFYRVVPDFVVQTGSYDSDGEYHRPRHGPIALESASGLTNASTTVAMARQGEPNSAVAEWFINLVDNGALDPKPGEPPNTTGYAVFGTVIDGMDTVDKIARVEMGGTGPFGAENAPKTPVVIKRITVLQ